MASVQDPSIDELNRQSARVEAETRKLMAETNRLAAERLKLDSERSKLQANTEFMPRAMIFQAMLATAALIGAGAAIAKLFFP